MAETKNGVGELVDHAALQASYAGRMCPILSMVGLRPPAAPLMVGLVGEPRAAPEGEAVGCQGPHCMWFLSIPNERGVIVGGSCAMALVPTAIVQVQNAVTGFNPVRTGDNKMKPRI